MKIKQAQSTEEARPRSPSGAGALRPLRYLNLAAARGPVGVWRRGRRTDFRCAPASGTMHLRIRGRVWPPAGSAMLLLEPRR